ncbi:unnamed protein product [Allacma fusca]|uniref:Uncharacterized protein n=1 Tax=Allacma fusca TaxID=39272 RepID=A0A8J2K7S0_9HEXA|nr:unnamed protein product [Allacma fusca]
MFEEPLYPKDFKVVSTKMEMPLKVSILCKQCSESISKKCLAVGDAVEAAVVDAVDDAVVLHAAAAQSAIVRTGVISLMKCPVNVNASQLCSGHVFLRPRRVTVSIKHYFIKSQKLLGPPTESMLNITR